MSEVRHRAGRLPATYQDQPSNADLVEPQPDKGWDVFCKVLLFVLVVLPCLAVSVLVFLVESPIEPQTYSLKPMRPQEGPLAQNDLLVSQGSKHYENKVLGPESIIYTNGHIYTGTYDGRVLHIEHSTGTIETIATLGEPPCTGFATEHTCGRPLGMRFDKDGYLIVLDGYLGLYKINVATKDVYRLLAGNAIIEGKPLRLLNDLDVASDGTVYFTDSSRFQRRNFLLDLLEHKPNGRLLRYNPADQTTVVLKDRMYFANGVQLSRDESYLLVAESTEMRVNKYYLKGEKAGQMEIFIDNLPGLVDNVRRSSGGGYWLAIPLCRYQDRFSFIDLIASYPSLNKHLAKLPWLPALMMPRCGFILEVNKHGEIIRSLQDLDGERLQFVTEVEEDAGTLYLGSFTSPYIGVVNTYRPVNV